MKKTIVGVVICLILAGIATTFIIRVNKKYAYFGRQDSYNMGEEVELDNFLVTVNDYEILPEDDFVNKYNIEKRSLIDQEKAFGDEKIESYVCVVKCTFTITGDVRSLPYADIGIASGGFDQKIMDEYMHEINSDSVFDLSGQEKGSVIEADIPFLIISKRFPYEISVNKLYKEKWKLYLSVTPGKYVKMEKQRGE